MNLINHAKSANHCQRIWADKEVDESLIEELIGVAVNMPTKQNEEYYGLLVSTNSEFNHLVYLCAYSADEETLNLPFEKRHLTNTNTQMRAPLQFHWLAKNQKFEYGNLNIEGMLSIGISAGAVALAANQLGLKTGFCVCIHQQDVLEKINSDFNIKYDEIKISLGIGYPDLGYPHYAVKRPDGSVSYKNIYEKNIPVFRK